MSPPPTTGHEPRPRRPLDSQKNAGGDMSMMFFVQSRSPKRFVSSEHHQIKGLNTETIARIVFPPPTWITASEYTALRCNSDEDSDCGFFSLSISIYGQAIDPPEWDDMWFFMYGRVHPYALTWQVESGDGLEAGDGLQDYTIPALIVRDQGYQPIAPRMFATADAFPLIPPIVTFTGPVLGSGHTLLLSNATPGLGDVQRKCCGFVQLSTFITPGTPNKAPFRGFHPFQVFVIFPIHANPWTSLCKRMIERQETQFQPNTLLTCTGKVAGFLDHRIMAHPPQLAQDYVFIVVPDTWTFHEKAGRDSVSASPLGTASAKKPSTDPFDRSKFMTPSKRAAQQPSTPTATTESTAGLESLSVPSTASYTPVPATPSTSSRPAPDAYVTPPAKRPNPLDDQMASPDTSKKLRTLQPTRNSFPSPAITSDDTNLDASNGLSPSLSLDGSSRPHRDRHPPKRLQS